MASGQQCIECGFSTAREFDKRPQRVVGRELDDAPSRIRSQAVGCDEGVRPLKGHVTINPVVQRDDRECPRKEPRGKPRRRDSRQEEQDGRLTQSGVSAIRRRWRGQILRLNGPFCYRVDPFVLIL
jgi:hypothetical protein